MRTFPIGVMSDCFRLGSLEGVRKAAELGADGVQVGATGGEVSPEMDAAARERFRAFCAEAGVEIAALCGDIGNYENAAENVRRVARAKQIVDLAADLATRVVTTHTGVVPEDPAAERYAVMRAALKEIADYAAGRGVTFAVETGPEKATTLKRLLDDVASPGLGVNLDPANLVMVVADDPAAAVLTLGNYIVHTHAKDGVQLRPVDAEAAYHGTEPPQLGPGFQEVPLGAGSVDWDAYLRALEEVGYRGYLTIEREVGDDPAGDIAAAMRFLRSKMA
jgi:L-ribulose-5-phosphate 3-epimerase